MKVSLFGDSILQSCNDNLAWDYGVRGIEIVDRFYMGGTAPCDWFDAAAHMQSDLAVVCFNGNMLTPCTQGRGTQLEVFVADMNHLGAIFAFIGKPVLWCGGPGGVDETENVNWRLSTAAWVAGQYGQRYTNASRSLASKVQGEWAYRKWMSCEPEDTEAGWCWLGVVNVREADNYHLSGSGRRRFSHAVVNAT